MNPDKIVGKLSSAGSIVAMAALAVMFIAISAEMAGRTFFNHPFGFTFDVAELMLLLIFYLPLALVQREGGHIRIDLVTSRLGINAQRIVRIVCTVVGMWWSATIVWMGIVILNQAIVEKSVSYIAKFLLYPFIWAIPVGGLLLFCALLLRLVGQLHSKNIIPVKPYRSNNGVGDG